MQLYTIVNWLVTPHTVHALYAAQSVSALLIIKNITLDPDPPVAGENLTVTATYDLCELPAIQVHVYIPV